MWLRPLVCWSVFILAAGWVMLCLNALLRRAWVDQTRLSFPIVRLPLALTEGFAAGSLLRSGPLWLGFAAAGGINLLNGFQVWFPFFIAWLVKWVVLRYGGLRFYRRALPFFLGLTLGDYTLGAIWTIIGVLWHVPTYQFQFF